jgi:hypothetical protein
MTAILQIALLVANITMAWVHAAKIEDGKPIKHWAWGGAYVISSLAMALMVNSWVFLLCAMLQRKVIFDCALNLFRHLPLFYVSNEPRDKSFWEAMDHDISVVDWLHYKAFGNRSELYVIVYLLLWVLGLAYMMAT